MVNQLETLPIADKGNVTAAVSIPTKSLNGRGGRGGGSITFGMGSPWRSKARLRSTNSESGYGSPLGTPVKSRLSMFDDPKEEKPEKQKLLDALPLITLGEVQDHCYEDDAWMVFYDRVYNVTNFLTQVFLSNSIKKNYNFV